MKVNKVYYTISKHNNYYHVWKNVKVNNSFGIITIFKSDKRNECIKYCKENNLNIRGN